MTQKQPDRGRFLDNRVTRAIRRRLAGSNRASEARIQHLEQQVDALSAMMERQLILSAQLMAGVNAVRSVGASEAEYRAFSQFGDDGLIQHFVDKLPGIPKSFVEFGVEDYLESNTRLLLMTRNWKGLVIDGSPANIEALKKRPEYWRHDLTAVSAFITAENINELISSRGLTGDIGVLHIDIDGNDYWVWKALTCVKPYLAIIEFNSLFGAERAVTVPYRPDFVRSQAHHSHLYAGASLSALQGLADQKGYRFIGCNSAGNNAYFVRSDVQIDVPQGVFVESRFREARDEQGRLQFPSRAEAIEKLRGLPVVNTRSGEVESF